MRDTLLSLALKLVPPPPLFFCFAHVISHTTQSATPENRVFSFCRSGQTIACSAPQVIYRFREPREGNRSLQAGKLVQVVKKQVFLVPTGKANHIHVSSHHLLTKRHILVPVNSIPNFSNSFFKPLLPFGLDFSQLKSVDLTPYFGWTM
jgi:hypothetical protein